MNMAIDLKSPPRDASVTSLVTGIINDAQQLFKQQFELLKTEVREDVRKTTEVGVTFGLGSGFALAGGILLLLMLVYLLQTLVPALPLWVCFGIVGGISLVGGAILVYVAKTTLDTFDPVPKETIKALEENVEALTHPEK
jgi:hypothetical protein